MQVETTTQRAEETDSDTIAIGLFEDTRLADGGEVLAAYPRGWL